MTIGIAAAGHCAGTAILETLARIEAVAHGAVGGFISVAAMTAEEEIFRAEGQRGGARALLRSGVPRQLLAAPLAVLMSSGPDRPAPLSQFTPARAGVGLVTGHRFPNTRGVDGPPLSHTALQALENGQAPQDAVDKVLQHNPRADAGLIALSRSGEIGIGNAALVRRHGDLGQIVERGSGYSLAVLHNSIHPHAVLGQLARDLLVPRLAAPRARAPRSIEIVAGLPVTETASRSVVEVQDGKATAIRLATAFHGDACWSAGLGPDAEILSGGRLIGHARCDPFLLIEDGKLASIDGKSAFALLYDGASRQPAPCGAA
ncbi:DUF6963 family protein [Mangrovicoccus algicola]|uniref:Uncharacterized protein n=1 Tax=Mangrovicoccus algicola TaxID=2771008 RepID=A0A8J6YUZ9_9RHOB|nr:hypothetical protein [Mangrovicoccus algicola]MBE3638122.1 hypothetical protein [Mangrovicoccus algicola]